MLNDILQYNSGNTALVCHNRLFLLTHKTKPKFEQAEKVYEVTDDSLLFIALTNNGQMSLLKF